MTPDDSDAAQGWVPGISDGGQHKPLHLSTHQRTRLMGNAINGALFGSLDTGDLLDGDLRPQLDPRVMFTACLDWLGGDVEQILGKRYEEIALLK